MESICTAPATDNRAGDSAGLPCEAVELNRKVVETLRAEGPTKALEFVNRSKVSSPWRSNALGVCLLRAGYSQQALDMFRSLVLGPGGIVMRAEAPAVFKANFAAALLATGNLNGFLAAMAELRDVEHASVLAHRNRIDRWAEQFTTWQKLKWRLGIAPAVPFPTNFEFGDLE